jgi:hypothetical protein
MARRLGWKHFHQENEDDIAGDVWSEFELSDEEAPKEVTCFVRMQNERPGEMIRVVRERGEAH